MQKIIGQGQLSNSFDFVVSQSFCMFAQNWFLINDNLLFNLLLAWLLVVELPWILSGIHHYYLQFIGCTLKITNIIIWQGKSECSDWFFLGQDSALWTLSAEMVISFVFFVFKSWQIQNKHGSSAIQ